MNLNNFFAGLGIHAPLSAAIRPLSGYHWELVFALIQAMSIFLVVAYLYCKSPAFKPFTTDVLGRRDRFYRYAFFAAISIMGTYLGLPVRDATANIWAIGPVLAAQVVITAALSSLPLSGNFPRTEHPILKAKGRTVEIKSCSWRGIEG